MLIHVLFSKELHCSLIYFSCMGKVAVLLFKAGILDPVLNIGMHNDKYTGVKEMVTGK